MSDNPYLASRKFNPNCVWYDSFAKDGKIAWLVFDQTKLLARVKNEQQAKNILEAIKRGRR